MLTIRLAEHSDIPDLVAMRWDFTLEDHDHPELFTSAEYLEFDKECKRFLENELGGEKWFFWVAELGGRIVSHIFIELVHKVPRPGRVTKPFVYMTNVYTRPEHRGKGIGTKLIQQINRWAREQEFEFIIVWPSEEGAKFYEKNGYARCTEPMEWA
jgi:GNAT superfamily N-acetyltransferase